jgi:hypothetical protein
MKKILIAVGALGVMSFTTNQIIDTWLLSEALNNVQDMREWMKEDIYNGRLDQNVGSDYLEVLDETEDLLVDFNDYLNLANYKLNTAEQR